MIGAVLPERVVAGGIVREFIGVLFIATAFIIGASVVSGNGDSVDDLPARAGTLVADRGAELAAGLRSRLPGRAAGGDDATPAHEASPPLAAAPAAPAAPATPLASAAPLASATVGPPSAIPGIGPFPFGVSQLAALSAQPAASELPASCSLTSVVPRGYAVGPVETAAVYAIWMYPTPEALAEDWAVTPGDAPEARFGACALPTGYAYWNENLLLAFIEPGDDATRSQLVDSFLSLRRRG